MKPSHFAVAPLLAVVLVGGSSVATDDKEPTAANPSLESYLPLIAEFDLRRRVNVLFPNPQTLFDGLQAGFVNVGSGNLTFLRRDLVTRANGPLVFGRVYDSRLNDDDFGPGWRLSLAEELHIDDAGVTYVDGAGSCWARMAICRRSRHRTTRALASCSARTWPRCARWTALCARSSRLAPTARGAS